MKIDLREPQPDRADAAASAIPTILTRTIAAPPGAPWDQARAADLEARLGAPLPIAELKYRLRRLDAWAPGRPGKFAAFYLKAVDYRAPFETVLQVEGAAVTVAFGANTRRLTQARTGLIAVGAGAAAVLLIIAGVGSAFSARSDARALADRAERLTVARTRTLDAFRHRQASLSAAHALAKGRTTVSELVTDLDWAGAGREADARILAAHMYQGLFAVEARGPRSPFTSTDRAVTRSGRPVHDDVWLWAVGPASIAHASDGRP